MSGVIMVSVLQTESEPKQDIPEAFGLLEDRWVFCVCSGKSRVVPDFNSGSDRTEGSVS
jgi:hypothetical protein